ncbi:unnamed protein product [Callosobruchus maculatus]|uniref:Uncharacterized protein n=1 Tax=Callosobruchus maculatus TaxID=64391 RepID=A0A653DLT3_CALMS|nr:unnamed protein product [Callosobruchus maculatus]
MCCHYTIQFCFRYVYRNHYPASCYIISVECTELYA